LACTIMGVELFGGGSIVLLAVACIASYVVVGERRVYGSQRVDTAKTTGQHDPREGALTVHSIAKTRRLRLPARPLQPSVDDEVRA
jgi:hypothetical protein